MTITATQLVDVAVALYPCLSPAHRIPRWRAEDETMRGTIPQEVLYRLPDVVHITGRSRAAIYRDIAEGRFPRPVQIGAQSVAWRKSDLDRWIATRPSTKKADRS